jgi:hypothetical protein
MKQSIDEGGEVVVRGDIHVSVRSHGRRGQMSNEATAVKRDGG